jgi:hypothetical protein|eukprot:COSAG06_NODE_434_length_15810_cov_9.319521_8_plen_218_part_00
MRRARQTGLTFRLDTVGLASCCPLCAACAPASAAAQQTHRSQRILRTLTAHTAGGDGGEAARWPHRPELKVTASEKFTGAPGPDFPSTMPLEFILQHTGLPVRSVSVEDFAAEWREQFRTILSAKDAMAQHDEFWATGASNDRALQWRLLEIPPRSAYPLHIHPGIEVYLVVRGVLVSLPFSASQLCLETVTPPDRERSPTSHCLTMPAYGWMHPGS